jgi:two-component system OmpR family sensor kinase
MAGPVTRPVGRPVARARAWLAGRTLRGRLIAGLVTLLAVACGLVGVITYLALRGGLYRQLDQQLAAASQRYVDCLHQHGPGRPPAGGQQPGGPQPGGGQHGGYPQPVPECGSQITGQAAGTFTARVAHYTVTNANINSGQCRLSGPDQAVIAALPAGHAPVTRELPSARGPYLLTAVRGSDGTVLVTGIPLASALATLRHVALTEAAVFGAVLLLAGVAGTGWVRLSLRPLARISATAAEVTALPLGSGEVELPHRAQAADPRTEVGQLGAAFNRMLGHLESALARRAASEDRLRSFAADASHELRTPLAAIRGYAELARRHPGSVPDPVAHALGRVEAESVRMSALVDDLLLLARLDAGRPLELGPVDLTRLCIDAASDARAAGPGHRWRLELPEGQVLVRGDDGRLRQVLANLLGNARMHTPAGTTVTVALRALPGRDAELTVADDGPGIPAALLPDLFRRFVRGDSSRSRAAGSTGLGLAIVDAVIAAHGGSVSVTSTPGQTCFTLTLPAGQQC